MSVEIEKRLELMKADYESVSGRSWQHFFCPILYRDEDAELCRGHVINLGFKNSDRSWVVQRRDVDNYFGTLFEGDFTSLEQLDDLQVDKVLVDRKLSRQFNTTFSVDDEPVNFYRATECIPENFTGLIYDSPYGSVKMALKISHEEMEEYFDGDWKVVIEKDIRYPALISCLKAAHLTLFHMLGYNYALSLGGRFLGKEILGNFFQETRGMDRRKALEVAKAHFKEFQNLVRPVNELSFDSEGTVTDKTLLLCMIEKRFWAFHVLIRTGAQLHAVLVPILDDPESANRFHRFLKSSFSDLIVKIARLREDKVWEVSTSSKLLAWPPADIDEPM